MLDLGTLGGTYSGAYGVNASGKVTGSSNTIGNSFDHAFLFDGTMQDLGTLGGSQSQGFGINASGQVVGQADGPSGTHAFLYDGTMLDLNNLLDSTGAGWTLTQARGINDFGQITGTGYIGGQMHAFLLTPVPEPSSSVLAAFGFVALAGWGWRRRKRA
jgi:probable HAF family extracellular repeat protein